jgi:hypothetical protein
MAAVAKAIAKTDPHTPGGKPEHVIPLVVEFFESVLEPYDWVAEYRRMQASRG